MFYPWYCKYITSDEHPLIENKAAVFLSARQESPEWKVHHPWENQDRFTSGSDTSQPQEKIKLFGNDVEQVLKNYTPRIKQKNRAPNFFLLLV